MEADKKGGKPTEKGGRSTERGGRSTERGGRPTERGGRPTGGTLLRGGSGDAGSREEERLRRALASQTAKAAEFESELARLRAHNALLNSELIEIRLQLTQQNEAYRALKLWLAGVPESGIVRQSGRREEQLVNALGCVSQSGSELALRSAAFCEEVRQLLLELPVGKVRQAELKLKIEALEQAARRVITLTEANPGDDRHDALKSCRILAVDQALSIVVLSVGSENGAFPGLIYRAGKEGSVQLRLVRVRPQAAAAVPVAGSIADLAPGMAAQAGGRREAVKSNSPAGRARSTGSQKSATDKSADERFLPDSQKRSNR